MRRQQDECRDSCRVQHSKRRNLPAEPGGDAAFHDWQSAAASAPHQPYGGHHFLLSVPHEVQTYAGDFAVLYFAGIHYNPMPDKADLESSVLVHLLRDISVAIRRSMLCWDCGILIRLTRRILVCFELRKLHPV